MSDPVREYVAGLSDVSGTFTGTFDPEAVAGLFDEIPELMPVEIGTFDQPNPVDQYQEGGTLTVTIGDQRWAFPIDHAESLGGNRVRVWVRRQGTHGAE